MALIATVLTWPLLLVGGSVSVYRVGMAVPDWPTTFGINMFLYRFWEAAWGVKVEHTHRLFGAAVGLACIVLAVWFAIAERRKWMKVLGAFTLLAVIAQGILGGLRVRMNSTNLAFVHSCSAEAFFGMMVALCVLTGRPWLRARRPYPDPERLRRRAAVTLLLVYLQIVAGAFLRHYGSGLGLVVHATLALAVWGHVAAFAWRVERRRSELPELLPSSRAMALAVTGQVALGVMAWLMLRPFDGIPRYVTTPQALIRVGHQGLGALLLAASLVLTLRVYRLLSASPAKVVAPAPLPSRALEAMA